MAANQQIGEYKGMDEKKCEQLMKMIAKDTDIDKFTHLYEEVIEGVSDPYAPCDFVLDLFSCACEQDNLEIAQFLNGHNYLVWDTDGPLGSAARNGNIEFIKFLLEIGFRLDSYDDEYWVVRHAINSGHKHVVDFFIEEMAFRPYIIQGFVLFAIKIGKEDIARYLAQKYLKDVTGIEFKPSVVALF